MHVSHCDGNVCRQHERYYFIKRLWTMNSTHSSWSDILIFIIWLHFAAAWPTISLNLLISYSAIHTHAHSHAHTHNHKRIEYAFGAAMCFWLRKIRFFEILRRARRPLSSEEYKTIEFLVWNYSNRQICCDSDRADPASSSRCGKSAESDFFVRIKPVKLVMNLAVFSLLS